MCVCISACLCFCLCVSDSVRFSLCVCLNSSPLVCRSSLYLCLCPVSVSVEQSRVIACTHSFNSFYNPTFPLLQLVNRWRSRHLGAIWPPRKCVNPLPTPRWRSVFSSPSTSHTTSAPTCAFSCETFSLIPASWKNITPTSRGKRERRKRQKNAKSLNEERWKMTYC